MVSNILSRRREDREKWGDRLPPGQKVVDDWPVLTYGGTPRVDLKSWRLRLFGLVDKEVEFCWQEFTSLPTITVGCDVHCVTSWSRMDNVFEGVAFLELMKHVKPQPDATAVIAHCYGGYTTNVILSDLRRDNVLLTMVRSWRPSTAAPAAWSCRTSTSGRAPNGCVASSSSRRTARASGSSTATTSAAILGKRSATPERTRVSF